MILEKPELASLGSLLVDEIASKTTEATMDSKKDAKNGLAKSMEAAQSQGLASCQMNRGTFSPVLLSPS